MSALTSCRDRINLPVGTFIFTLITMGFTGACDDAIQSASCEDQLYECDDSFPEVADNIYCWEQNTGTGDRMESCANFRRGQMCSCLSAECYTELAESVPTQNDPTLEKFVDGLRCPKQQTDDQS